MTKSLATRLADMLEAQVVLLAQLGLISAAADARNEARCLRLLADLSD
ncbi:MAG: hypothetical protein JJ902_03025 [Roseibium sp.]|nr:hypothetical protein [Roseibium sp.]